MNQTEKAEVAARAIVEYVDGGEHLYALDDAYQVLGDSRAMPHDHPEDAGVRLLERLGMLDE